MQYVCEGVSACTCDLAVCVCVRVRVRARARACVCLCTYAYLREKDLNGSKEERQSVLQLREVEDEDEYRSQRPGIS